MPAPAPPPRRRFSQNFLRNPAVAEHIVRAVGAGPDDHIVEIGPGRAALSGPLAATGARLDLIEIDRDLAAALRSRFADEPRVTVHAADALRVSLAEIAGTARVRVVGNLPYNISTPLLFRLLDQLPVIEDLHLMLQREVVERMAARPGEAAYGRLSVMLQRQVRVEALFTVPASAFRPVPKVESAFARLRPHLAPPVRVEDPRRFAEVVARAFSARRKTIRNGLRGLLDAQEIAACGIDPGVRPERLGLADFAALANAATAAAVTPRNCG